MKSSIQSRSAFPNDRATRAYSLLSRSLLARPLNIGRGRETRPKVWATRAGGASDTTDYLVGERWSVFLFVSGKQKMRGSAESEVV